MEEVSKLKSTAKLLGIRSWKDKVAIQKKNTEKLRSKLVKTLSKDKLSYLDSLQSSQARKKFLDKELKTQRVAHSRTEKKTLKKAKK